MLTAAWYRWRDLRCGGQTPVRRYLIAGLGLAVVTAALPALAWGTPIPDFPGPGAFLWLGAFWQQGTFVLLALAVNLAICAWLGRSLALAGIVAGYVAAVGLATWLELHQVIFLPVLSPIADPAVVLPATVLMLAGLGAVTITGVQALRSRGSTGRR